MKTETNKQTTTTKSYKLQVTSGKQKTNNKQQQITK